jgi:hypothetical protein
VRSRTLLGVAGWLAAAVVAVAVGLAAVRFIVAGLAAPEVPVLAADEVAEALASAPPATPARPSSSAPAPPSAGPAARTATFDSRGGLVTARCARGVVTVVGTSPAQGYAVHEVEDGRAQAEVDFRAGRPRVKVRITCDPAGRPVASTETRDD